MTGPFTDFTPDDFNQFQQGWDASQNRLNQFARQRAGNMLAGGDVEGAANALYRAGDLTNGFTLQQHQQQLTDQQRTRQARATALEQYQSGDVKGAMATAAGAGDAETLSAIGKLDDAGRAEATRRAGALATAGFSLKPLPYAQRRAALGQMAPQLASLGLNPDQIAGFDPTDANIDAITTQALGLKDAIERHDKLSKPIEMDPSKNYYLPDEVAGLGSESGSGSTSQPSPAAATLSADQVWANMKRRESGGNGDAVSPAGAIGSTQMLPATAEGMARKLGVAWRPDLMRGNSPAALAYQDKLGRAYFDEGLQRYGGDLYQAASYYHGGPDQKIWGPKTRAYANAVTGGVSPYQVAANGSTPPPPRIPGYHLVSQARPQWQPDGKGALVNSATGDRKTDPSFAGEGAEEALTPEAIDQNAMRYAMTGQLPPMGAGKQAAADKRKVMNRAAQLTRQYGIKPEDWVTGMAQFKVTQGSLGQISKVKALVNASENTVLANADIALSLAPRGVGPTGVPVFNRWINAGRKNLAGDPDVAKFDVALHTVADEYAKVMTTSTGTSGAALTDSARAEAYRRLSTAQTLPQLQGVIGVMKREMANRSKALTDQEAALTGQLRNGVVPPGQQPSSQPGAPASPGPRRRSLASFGGR